MNNNDDRKFLHFEWRTSRATHTHTVRDRVGAGAGASAGAPNCVLCNVHVERIRHSGNARMNGYVQNATV